MNSNHIKQDVIEGMVVRMTLDGAFQRAKIYNSEAEVSDKQRIHFRNSIALTLESTLIKIQAKNKYCDTEHYQTIEEFVERIGREHDNILHENRLRIGIGQKLINLYWKCSWILKPDITPLAHCPFDSVIIKKLGSKIPWTKDINMADYQDLVRAAYLIAGHNRTIAD